MEPVRIGIGFAVVDSSCVELVDADIPRRMDDESVAHADAHMDNTPLVVLKEGKIVATGVADAHFVATCGLL